MIIGPNWRPGAELKSLQIASADELANMLRSACMPFADQAEQTEAEDQLEALIPALVELRDAGHLQLTTHRLARYCTVAGFDRLASDERLSPLSRQRCSAIRTRMMAGAVRSVIMEGRW